MVLTRRGKVTAAIIGALILAGTTAGAYVLLNRADAPTIASTGEETPQTVDNSDSGTPPPPPPEPCPLTGVAPGGGVPDRPVLAIKVEDSAAARPQAGLAQADIVYEQPVEGGITRFVAVFHCQDADRVGPVRSARFMDANLLPQFGTPLFGYAGGAPETRARIAGANMVDLSYIAARAIDAYVRDPARSMPHDLFTSTGALYEAAGEEGGDPRAVFAYSARALKGSPAASVHVPFNPGLGTDVEWRWSQSRSEWLRYLGSEPHVLEDGSQISATNVIVQVVELRATGIIDAAGSPSPEVVVIGSGAAFVFRSGKVIEGTWRKDSPEDITHFVTKRGKEIRLAPGTTWVEFVPGSVDFETSL